MDPGRVSQTAQMVTFMRALANAGLSTVPGFADPTAERFLAGRWLRAYQRVSKRREGIRAEFARRSGDLMALRTLVIDDHLREAIARGARQVVLMGAGFDGRSYRMAELAQTRVFEVDHPDTQRIKRERAVGLPLRSLSHAFVPVDFEKGSIDAPLEAAGHRVLEPTVWIWEGVVMYLTDEAFHATLRAISARSAVGSTLIVQYNTPGGIHPFGLLLRMWREPLIGKRSQQTTTSALNAVGYQVTGDSAADEWAARYRGRLVKRGYARRTRILAARRS